MFSFLKRHPFAVEAFFKSSLVFTFAFPKEELEALIPECLELDTFQDKYAFIAVAMVQTQGLRPKGFPKFMGNDFFLIGYRIFVKYHNEKGKRLRGLYIIKSETDRLKMKIAGNIFTHYNYTTTDIQQERNNNHIKIKSLKSKMEIDVDISDKNIPLPVSSPFSEWKEARRFAGPLPFTFTYDENTKQVLIIQGVRQNWKPKPVQVNSYSFDLENTFGVKNGSLANAFIIENIPYYWKKGEMEIWKTKEQPSKA